MNPAPKAYYNENDKFAAAWLRNLISAGLIADGEVDERDIRDVFPIDLAGYTQCHFFAGIGGWSYALRLAGWPDDKPCWTGSCPCQPFSAAGQGAGFDDERHLWPAFFHLVEQRHPPVIFGEQVASKAGLTWLDLVQTDLEAADYATTAVDLCAAGIGAPHIRQRLFWCANSMRPGRAERRAGTRNGSATRSSGAGFVGARGEILARTRACVLSDSNGRESRRLASETMGHGDTFNPTSGAGFSSNTESSNGRNGFGGSSIPGDMPSSSSSNPRRQGLQEQLLLGRISIATMEPSEGEAFVRAGYTRGFWGGCDWWHGRDEKFRPIKSGLQPLASGVSKRMGKLRGYGNSIVAPLAAEFIKSYTDCCPEG